MKRSLVVIILLLIFLAIVPASPATPIQLPLRIMGIFGGMGPEATVNFYAEVVRLTPAQKDQDHVPALIFSYPQVPDRTEAIRSGDRAIVAYLVAGVQRLEKAGACFIAIPCNTAHYYYDDMQHAVSIPIINMIRETADAVARLYPQKRIIGLLGTSGTILSGLYQKELEKRGCRVLIPDERDQGELVMKSIYAIKAGADKRKSEDRLALAGKHLERRGAELIVLGCTEIPLAFNPRRARVPVVNATRVLAEAAIRMYRQEK